MILGEYSNLSANEGCLVNNKLRTIQPQISEKNKNSQHELKFTGSYKKSVDYNKHIETTSKKNYCRKRKLSLRSLPLQVRISGAGPVTVSWWQGGQGAMAPLNRGANGDKWAPKLFACKIFG